jgi:hypothetical protein
MMRKTPLAAFIILALSYSLYSQCSDAGVCVIGKNHNKEMKTGANTVSLSYIFGTSGKDADINGALNNLTFGTVRLDADMEITKSLRVNTSIPYTFVTGPLGENNGVGDASIVFSKGFKIEKVHQLTFFLGGKFATGNVNSSDSLPQRYMPGLGTNDLLGGATYTYTNYYFGVAYQKPFGRSRNYDTRLKRGDDVLVRAGFFEQFNKVGVKAEILTILRVQPSSVRNPAGPDESFITIDGSNETQVNLLGTVSFMASREIMLTGQVAIPFLKRNYNYDGLKRTLSIAGTIGYMFDLQ